MGQKLSSKFLFIYSPKRRILHILYFTR